MIVSTASIGAIAFGVRQATKNPEAWYVSTVLIESEKNVIVENKTSVLCYKTKTYLIRALFRISSDEVASHAMECKLLEGFCLGYFLFHFSVFSLQNVTGNKSC